MATIEATASGAIRRVRQDDGTAFGPVVTDGGTTQTLDLDETTNGATLAALRDNPARYALAGGQLLRDGAAVALAAPGVAFAERADLQATGAQALADLTTYLGLASPTAAQTTAVVKLLARIARFLLRRALAS